jgi:peptidoglycan/xylan/chitin deacetylase (PgdA/CDA1 family)
VTETAARGGRDAALVAALALAAYATPALSVPVRRFPGIVTRGRRPTDAVALTFDDGPHPQGTPAVLEALDRAGARASFFVVGEAVRRHRGLLAEILSAGHEIALHGDRHLPHALMLPRSVLRDLERGRAEVEQEAPRVDGRGLDTLGVGLARGGHRRLDRGRRHPVAGRR